PLRAGGIGARRFAERVSLDTRARGVQLLLRPSAEHEPVKDIVRIGVVGAGAIAQLAHLPVLAKMRGVELVGVCDNDRPKARALADRFGIPDTFTDIEDLLEVNALDAVV